MAEHIDEANRLFREASEEQNREACAETRETTPPNKETYRAQWEKAQNNGEDSAAAATPFPTHCLPKDVREMATAITQSVLVPERLSGCCVLGILSASVGKGIHIQSGPDRFTRGNLFLMASADSGTGKSETIREAAKPLHSCEMEVRDQWKRRRLSESGSRAHDS